MYLGIDTSNYTTSVALFDGNNIVQSKKLLSVKSGERGLRQSDALFQHTVNLPELVGNIDFNGEKLDAVSVSTRPRSVEGSYMPCFLAGVSLAQGISRFKPCKLYKTSHQTGHILAALYSVNKLDLIKERFIAFHVSGGTTEALLVQPSSEELINITLIAQSLDLKAGQAVDRTGVLLGLDFPCGKALDELSLKSVAEFKHRPSLKGADCSLSGVENKVKAMVSDGVPPCDIARFTITYIEQTLSSMTEKLIDEYGNLPLVFAGGVMSNTIIRKSLTDKFGAMFAEPQFSCDNAAGVALYGYLKDKQFI